MIASKVTTVLLVLLVLWLARDVLIVAAQKTGAQTALRNAQTKLDALQKEHRVLEKTIGYLKNPRYLEREARAKLNFKAVEEKVAFIYRDTTPEKVASGSHEGEYGGLAKIKNWLYDMFRR